MFSVWWLSFVSLLFYGVLVVLSGCYWVSAWIGLEVNLIAIVPMIVSVDKSLVGNGGLNYFLIQIISSVGVLLVSLLGVNVDAATLFLPLPLLIKLGLFPFWVWVPHVFITSSLFIIFILSSVQNLAPLLLLSGCYWVSAWIGLVLFFLSCFIGGVGGVKALSLKNILAYSSIVHSSWLGLCSIMSIYLWVVYVLLYIVVLALVMVAISQITTTLLILWVNSVSNYHNLTVVMNLISLSGLPPFLGFVIKVFIFSTLMVWCPWNVGAITIILPLTTFYYFQLFLTNNTLSNPLDVVESYLIPSLMIGLILVVLMVS